MNLGLSEKLIIDFPEYYPVERPIINTESILNPNWISGFVTGDGSFSVIVHPAPRNKVKFSVLLRFRITQHKKDSKLMELIVKHLGAGKVYKNTNKPAVYINISDFKSITNLIIPFFEKNPVHGAKSLDFIDWCKIQKLIFENKHRTLEGLDLINNIRSGMNNNRNNNNI